MSQAMVRAVVLAVVTALVAAPPRVQAASNMLPSRLGMYSAASQTPLPMLESRIDIAVRGPIVEAVIEQRFRNASDHATEATYIFPLPPDAAVTAMSIRTGNRTITAAIERREQARERYEAAITAGLPGALLDQERPDVFTQAVAAIPAKGEVVIKLRVDFTARYRAGTWELALPLVVAPRYVPGSASGRPTVGSGHVPDTDRAPDASRVTPPASPGAGGKTRVAVTFADTVEDVTSPTHEVTQEGTTWQLADPKSDHDMIVRWRAHVPQTGWVEQDGADAFAAVVVQSPPPAARTASSRVMFVVDRAATTRGDADLVEHPLVRALFDALGASDRVAVSGSDHIEWGAPADVGKRLDSAWQKAGGAFDLTAVLGKLGPGGAAVVLVSDGLVADDRAALAAATKLGVPVHVVGVGPAPNRSLLAAIATATGGTVRFATVDDDLAALASDVLADAASQPAPLQVTWGTLAATDIVPATLPRAGAGQSVLVVARVKRAQQANARARGDVFVLGSVGAPRKVEGATTTLGPLGRVWARMKLEELVVAGNAEAIAQHALRYGLVSPQTSMVGVGAEVTVEGGVKHSIAVPVSVPEGMHWQAVQQQTVVSVGGENDRMGREEELKDRTNTYKRSEDEVEEDDEDGEVAKPHKTTKTGKKPDKHTSKQPPRHEPTRDTVPAAGVSATVPDSGVVTQSAPPPVANEPPRVPREESVDVATGADASESDDNEPMQVELASAPGVYGDSARRPYRLSLGFGAGISVERHHESKLGPVAALSGRLDAGQRTLFGIEGALWLVGTDAQGQLELTLARRGIARLFELRGGFGLHFGDGYGPAASLTLRTRLPVRHLATYLRWDGALLQHPDASRSGQNTSTFGVESSW
jgi:Ca-activated chloride channel family protein